MCVLAGSLHHAIQWKPDVLIADEVHELATDSMFDVFAEFRFARMIGLSANFDDRFDKADFELEGVFGPLVAELSYPDAQKHGLVVPASVIAARDEARAHADPIAEFIGVHYVDDPAGRVRVSEMRTYYESYAGKEAISNREFNAAMEHRGFHRNAERSHWCGLSSRTDEADEAGM